MSKPDKNPCQSPETHELHLCQLKKRGLSEDIALRANQPEFICHNCGLMANKAEDLCNCSSLPKRSN